MSKIWTYSYSCWLDKSSGAHATFVLCQWLPCILQWSWWWRCVLSANIHSCFYPACQVSEILTLVGTKSRISTDDCCMQTNIFKSLAADKLHMTQNDVWRKWNRRERLEYLQLLTAILLIQRSFQRLARIFVFGEVCTLLRSAYFFVIWWAVANWYSCSLDIK